MSFTIQIKRKAAVPVNGNLQEGEFGLDTRTGKVYVGYYDQGTLKVKGVRMGGDNIQISEVTDLQDNLDNLIPISLEINGQKIQTKTDEQGKVTYHYTLGPNDVKAIDVALLGRDTGEGVPKMIDGKIQTKNLPDTAINGMERLGNISTLNAIFIDNTFPGSAKGSKKVLENGHYFIASASFNITFDTTIGNLTNAEEWAGYTIKSVITGYMPDGAPINGDKVLTINPGDWVVVEEIDTKNAHIYLSTVNNNATDLYAPITHVGSTNGHPDATTSKSGFMSAADKTKLNTVKANAEPNQNAFSHIYMNGSDFPAGGKTSTFGFTSGAGINIQHDTSNPELSNIFNFSVDLGQLTVQQLSNVPALTGHANKIVVVNASANGLTYINTLDCGTW